MRMSTLLLLSFLFYSYTHALGISPFEWPLPESTLRINGLSSTTRMLWMQRANEAVQDVNDTPCPFGAFGTVVVNHSTPEPGELVCAGGNLNSKTGNPSLHGMYHNVS